MARRSSNSYSRGIRFGPPRHPSRTVAAREHFEIGPRTARLDERIELHRLRAVPARAARSVEPRPHILTLELLRTAHSEHHMLGRAAEVVANAEGRLAPCQHRDVAESPARHQLE